MKNDLKNNDKNAQFKNQQSGQVGKEQKYGKDIGSVEPKADRDLDGNTAGRDTSASKSSSVDDLDDTDDENVY